jgi:hypothetical protein
MVIANIYVDGVSAKVTDLQKIPKGIAGAVIEVEYAANWDGLMKTAVFTGAVTRDVLNAGGSIVIPAETVAKSGHRLRVGFYGVDGENNVIIPTLWADLGIIQDAADPSGDPGTDPELPVWAQLQQEFEELKEAGGITGPPGKDGYTPQKGIDYFDGKDGQDGKDGYTPVKGVDYFDGADGQPGADGKDYVLTEADKTEIAEMAAELVEVPEAPAVSMQPLTFTGAVNATYDGSEAVSVEIPQGGGSGSEYEYMGKISFADAEVNQLVFDYRTDGNGNQYDVKEVLIVGITKLTGNSKMRLEGEGKWIGSHYAESSSAMGAWTGFTRIKLEAYDENLVNITAVFHNAIQTITYTGQPWFELHVSTADVYFSQTGAFYEVYVKRTAKGG